jgi:hypothetical protein
MNCIAAPQSTAQAAVGCGSNTYRENPRVRKQKSQTALIKAMELNATVVMMVQKGSEEFEKMAQLLSQSYGYQITAIGQMEGLVRESCHKDPTLERGILDMYTKGKPPTEHAAGILRLQSTDGVIESLSVARQTHQQFLLLTY